MPPPTPIRGLGPDSALGDAARRILAGRLADARHPEAQLDATTLDVDAVHDMRVATRRLRAALQVFRATGKLTRLEVDVKRLQDALGDVRDLHVQDAWLGAAAKGQKDAGKALLDLRRTQRSGLKEREKTLRAELGRWTERTVPRLLKKLDTLEDSHRFASKRARGHLRLRLRRVEKRLERYAEAPDAASAHALRRDLKKLRYELEIFQPAFRRTVGALLGVLVPLQDGLGELHDADVRLELFERAAAEAPTGQRKAARKLLPQAREERAERSAEIAREVQRWHAEAIPKRLRKALT
ncbi:MULTISPECIES: CHAD domain-containing protein [Corallococcus]|uniref:CHAD domain-containing protein n=1 Tax=Corallococcus TaxID=83461 RepID=UPI00117ECF78|nr:MULTISPECIES: CHAD domain-containing protein [Corallococcus]NBD13764.1 CHAD domain-containing protein [Corallococcus silvisoli]TSC22853.1 CHAD domain-containing protein [Corallococcus sp. Z5C101001]